MRGEQRGRANVLLATLAEEYLPRDGTRWWVSCHDPRERQALDQLLGTGRTPGLALRHLSRWEQQEEQGRVVFGN